MAEKNSKAETQKISKPKCGIIMPISELDGYSAEHWAQVKEILLETINQTDFEGDLVSKANEIRVIHETIVQNIYFNEMVVCDVSGKNPNVMFELGLRIAFDKPVVVIKDDSTNYSFDTSPIEHLEYPTDLNYRRINQFKKELKDKINATFENAKTGSPYLKSFGKFEVARLEAKEISSEDYILKSLDELKNSISRLENPFFESISPRRNVLEKVLSLRFLVAINENLENTENLEAKITKIIRKYLSPASTAYSIQRLSNALLVEIQFNPSNYTSHIETFKINVVNNLDAVILEWVPNFDVKGVL